MYQINPSKKDLKDMTNTNNKIKDFAIMKCFTKYIFQATSGNILATKMHFKSFMLPKSTFIEVCHWRAKFRLHQSEIPTKIIIIIHLFPWNIFNKININVTKTSIWISLYVSRYTFVCKYSVWHVVRYVLLLIVYL